LIYSRFKRSARFFAALVGVSLAAGAPASAGVELKSQAASGFDRYVQLTEARMAPELSGAKPFLWLDNLPEPRRSQLRAHLRSGEIISEKLQTSDPSGGTRTPGALIHHWVGTVFIAGASLQQVLAIVQDYDRHAEYYKPDVVQSRLLEHTGNEYRVYYRLRKKKVVTVLLNAEYDVHRYSLDSGRAYSESRSTRVAQVENPGEPGERELPPGKDGGYMWRLNSYWRYAEADGGVYVQCEALSLTRDIPAGLNWLIAPFIESVPRESLEFTLESTRTAVLHLKAQAPK
jgi:hypothetical protein